MERTPSRGRRGKFDSTYWFDENDYKRMNSVFCIYLAMILIPGVGISKYTYITWWRHQMEKNPRYWPFVRGIHRSPVNSPHKGQWRGALMFYLICAWINGWVNNREPGDLRRYRAHYDVTIPITTHMHVVNTFGSKQNCHHLTGDILNFFFCGYPLYLGRVMEIRLSSSCYLVLLSTDSKSR